MTTTIDWLATGDAAVLQSYIERWWRSGHVLARDETLLRWQYADRGHPERLSILGAWENDELVGFLGLVQEGFAMGGEHVPAAWLAMWHATPEAQTRRVGLALLLEALRLPFAVIGCLGMNPHAVAIYERLGFEVVPRLPRWVLPLDPDALDALVSGSSPARPAVDAASAADDCPAPSPGSEARWDAAWDRLVARGLAGTWRDSTYLRHRYLEHPRFRYHVRLPDDGSALLVYRIEHVAGRDEQVIRVVECLGPAARLAAEAVDAHPNAALADFYCTLPTAAAPLEEVGFLPESALGRPAPERFQPLALERRGLNGAFLRCGPTRAVYCTKSDGDQDRPS